MRAAQGRAGLGAALRQLAAWRRVAQCMCVLCPGPGSVPWAQGSEPGPGAAGHHCVLFCASVHPGKRASPSAQHKQNSRYLSRPWGNCTRIFANGTGIGQAALLPRRRRVSAAPVCVPGTLHLVSYYYVRLAHLRACWLLLLLPTAAAAHRQCRFAPHHASLHGAAQHTALLPPTHTVQAT